MKKISRSIPLTLLTIWLSWAILCSCGLAQEIGAGAAGPQSPPVDITFTVGTIFRVGEEVELKIKVTPQEDMHADISCLLPRGIEPVREEAVIVRPYRGRYPHDIKRRTNYMEAVALWTGPLEGGRTKEFSFRVVIPDKERYEFIARVQALAKWGVKEKSVIIDIIN